MNERNTTERASPRDCSNRVLNRVLVYKIGKEWSYHQGGLKESAFWGMNRMCVHLLWVSYGSYPSEFHFSPAVWVKSGCNIQMKNVNKSEGFIDKIATDTRLLRLLYTRNDRGSSLLLSDTKESKEESIVCEISRFVHRSIFDSSHISIHRIDYFIIK